MTVTDFPGSARLMLVDTVSYLEPESAVFTAMLDGWARQQRTRGLAADTVRSRAALVRRLYEFSGLYPWQWTCAEVEAFFDQLRSAQRSLALSTLRGYQVSLRMFVEFVCDKRYGWPETCLQRFGQAPTRVELYGPRRRVRGPPRPAAADLRRGADPLRCCRRSGSRYPASPA